MHPLVAGNPLILGGVHIPHSHGLSGHSDADVLYHATADALLGGVALGDLGLLFPPGDPDTAGVDSAVLLRDVAERVANAGWKTGNLDCTLIAEAPRLAPFMPAMRENLADCLSAPLDCISVKAKTTETLGFIGRGEGIAAQVTVLLIRA